MLQIYHLEIRDARYQIQWGIIDCDVVGLSRGFKVACLPIIELQLSATSNKFKMASKIPFPGTGVYGGP